MFNRFAAGVLGVVLSAALASAQATMSVSGGAVLTAGDTVQITYQNPAKTNGSVVIRIDDGAFPNPTYVELTVHLGKDGKGTVSWVVPAWWCASFNADGVKEINRAIN